MSDDDFGGTNEEYTARWKEERAAEIAQKWERDMCAHMRALVLYCEEHGVTFGGCGDCGSPWLTCSHCSKQVDDAADVFKRGATS